MLPNIGAIKETIMPINTKFALFFFVVASVAFFIGIGLVFWWVCRFRKAYNASGLGSHPSVNLPQRPGKETRKEPRADVNWAVSMDTSEGVAIGVIKNVSLGGAFVCCKKPLPLGEIFHLTMIGPDGEPLTATAEVIWSNANVPDGRVINRGMGIRLTKVSDKHILSVQQIFQK